MLFCPLPRLPLITLGPRLATLCLLLLATLCQPTHAEPASEQQALHLLNRLGYGPAPGDVARVMQMGAEAYIQSQLNPEKIALPAPLATRLAQLETLRAPTGKALAEFAQARKAARDDDADKQQLRMQISHLTEQTAEARLVRAISSPRQLEEVMVDFWFNHFNVYAAKGLDRVLVASYERDAIRPHALGNFRALLGATAHHPAMLFYLDNWLSTRADFQPNPTRQARLQRLAATAPANAGLDASLAATAPKNKARGLNENYARELMELHTLGVEGGYSQQDVTELARMLTGWTFLPRAMEQKNELFYFDASRHDNGSKQWLGRSIAAQGQREGELALDVLAGHPATAKHISFKLAQYFVADQPPPALVARLAQQFIDGKGEIRPLLATLFASPEFMASGNAKFKTPYQFVISAARAANTPIGNIRPLLGTLSQLGQPLYGSVTPDGYKNTEAAWLAPDALGRRVQFATALATGRLPLNQSPANPLLGKKMLDKQATPSEAAKAAPLATEPLLATLGASISPATREVISQQPAALRAALILGSPDFMRH